MALFLDIPHLRRFGWVRIDGAVPVRLCERLVEVLEAEIDVPVHDQSRWHRYGGEPRDLLPIWGHQAQWDIRQHPYLHRIWATLWGTDRLGCRSTHAGSRRPGSRVASFTGSIGITIRGMPRYACSKACSL